jgi:hypothetical protein
MGRLGLTSVGLNATDRSLFQWALQGSVRTGARTLLAGPNSAGYV